MSLRQGRFDLAERQAGILAIREARSPEALAKLIDECPVLHAPELHREVFRLLGEELPLEDRRQFARFFLYLDWKAQQRQAAALKESEASPRVDAPSPYAPPYFQQLMERLEGRVPPWRLDRPLDPSTEAAGIEEALTGVRGSPVTLPPYQSDPGSQWGIVVMECLRCHVRRPEVRAVYIDLTRAPALRAPLMEGRINNARCPSCGFTIGLPAGVWVLEPPAPRDPLAVLSCIVRVNALLSIYVPACWRPHDHEMDVVLEARSFQLLDDLQSRERPETADSTRGIVSIVYSQDELTAQVGAVRGGEQIPPMMEAAIARVAFLLEAKKLSVEEARVFARAWVEQDGQDWPVLMSPIYLDDTGRPLRSVAHALLTEELAEWQKFDALDRALYAIQSVAMLLEAQRIGQAEAQLARAEDFWRQAESQDDDRYRVIASMLEGAHSDVLVRQGRYQEAARHRRRAHEILPLNPHGSWWERQEYWRQHQTEALHLRREGRFDESLAAFSQCVPMLEQLYSETLVETSSLGREGTVHAQQGLSMALANCASVLMEGDEAFRATEQGEASADPEGVRERSMTWVLEYAQRLPAWQSEPEGDQDEGSRRWIAAGRLLAQALVLSKAAQSWAFATAQAMRLADVMVHFGLLKEAVDQASEWVKHAQRAENHNSLAEGLFFIGRMGIHLAQEAPGALDVFESAAEALLRHLVSRGPGAEPPSWASALVEFSFLCVLMGAPAEQAVMIAESLKAALTAIHLEIGVPGSGDQGRHALAQRVEDLTREREMLRLDQFNFDEGEPELEQVLDSIEKVEQQLSEERRALSLRDAQYVRWCETAYMHMSTADGIRRRLEALSPRATYLGFCIGTRGVWTYALWSEGCTVDLVSWPGWREDLRDLREPDALLSNSSGAWTKLERVGRHLLEPVLGRLESMSPSDRLIISPAGELLHVPFAALLLGSERLAQRVVISVVSGSGLFEACFERRPGPVSSALLVGVSRHDYKTSLPFAREEVKQLERLFEGSAREVRTLLDQEATASAVLAEAAGYDVLHVASHAEWSQQAAIRPQLVLYPDFSSDSGALTDWRISNELRLRPGTLVNLSACQSARQIDKGAEVRDGLVPAFLHAGAGAVIATFWSIRDAPSPTFQNALYQHLLAGLLPADALAQTLRNCISGDLGPILTDPLVWSAFVLHGVG